MTHKPDHPESQKDLLRVLEVARTLAVVCDLPQLLTQVIDAGRDVLKADRGSVFLYDPPNDELYMTTGTGLASLRFSAKQGLAGQCATTRTILNIPDCYADPRFNQDIDKQTGYRTHCMMTIPLIGLEDKLVGVMQLLNADKGTFDQDDEHIALALAGQAAVAIQRAQLLEEQQVKIRMQQDLALAKDIQQGVLPKTLPHIEGYDLAVFSQPADETGGDIYDVIEQDEKIILVLADATGHGIGPALSVTQMRAMFRMGLRLGADLNPLVQHIDEQLEDDLDGSRFITAFFGLLDPQTHQIHYEAPGQAPLLCYHAQTDQFESRDASSVPLGVMPLAIGDITEPFEMDQEDIFILLTDGFYECQREDDEQFGTLGVQQVIREHHNQSAKQIIKALINALHTFAPGCPQADDWTAIIVKRISTNSE